MVEATAVLPHRGPVRIQLRTGLTVFIWLLPFHIVLMAWLFGGLGLPGPLVRLIAAWKEGLIAVLLAATAVRMVRGGGERTAVQWLDLAVFGLALLALLYLLGAGFWFGLDVPVGARLYGLRDAVYFSLLYFVGRATPEIVRDERALKALFLVGVVTSALAVLERLFVTPAMLVLLGAASYFQDFLGVTLVTAGNAFGLPANYWVYIGDHLVRRAGSTYLSSQGFAVPFLIIVPAATVWILSRRRGLAAQLGYALLWVGLLLTITRMTIIACGLEALAIAALRRRWEIIAAAATVVVVGVGYTLVLAPDLATFLWQTLTFQSSSSLTHTRDWVTGLENALRYPLGVGLGVAEQASIRFGLTPLEGENQFLMYAVELGVLGLALHLATMAGAVLTGLKTLRDSESMRAAYGVVVAATAAGILLNGMTTAVFNSMPLTYVFFWLLGSLATASRVRE